MKMFLTGCILAAGVAVACLPAGVAAHALRAAHEQQGDVILVRFAYSDGKGPEFAAVRVTAADGTEFQNGRTDARGRFAFVPDAPGTWRISVTDGMGHKVEHAVDVAVPGTPNETARPDSAEAALPLPLRAALGLSLLANLALLASLFRRRGSARQLSPASGKHA